MSDDDVLLVVSTFPDVEKAREITRRLVEERLAACGNVLAGAESIFRWQGEVETAREAMAFFKTTRMEWPRLEARLRELHPYEVPEIIALPLAAGAPAYLDWVREQVGG